MSKDTIKFIFCLWLATVNLAFILERPMPTNCKEFSLIFIYGFCAFISGWRAFKIAFD